jgi:uncharacterized protein (TIGR03067 family)
MRMVLSLAIAFSATTVVAADFDAKKLEGTWTFKSGMKAGTKAADESLKGEVVVKGDVMKMPLGDMMFEFKLVIDGKKTPVEVDMEITEGPIGKGEKRKGILSLEGDELKICYPADGSADRPTKFDGEKNHLFVLTKKKAK